MRRSLLICLLLFGILILHADVLIYGDTRSNPDVHRSLIDQVRELPLSAVFHTGDLNRRGVRQAEFDRFKDIIRPLSGDFYPVRGNHERDLDLFLKNFPQLGDRSHYSVTHDSLKYIILDSNISLLPATDQYLWLQQELKFASLPVIIFLHHPVFSSGAHGQELGLELFLPNLLKRYEVMAVISGHEHSFEHLVFDGIHYLVTGGGGAPLREMGSPSPHSQFFIKTHHYNILKRLDGSLLIQTLDLQGEQIYQIEIPLPGVRDE